jgi:L-alanine-DL-glutamate epimerase-like enolase superfamily enzyme
MRVEGIDVTAVDVPYRHGVRPVVTSGLVLTGANHLLVRVRTDDGHWGIGEAVPRPSVYGENRDGIAAAIRDYLGPALIGSDPFAVMSAWQSWSRVVGHNTAKAALDIALHDLAGRVTGTPLYRLLGGRDPGAIQLSRALGIGEPDVVAEEAAAAVEAGYGSIKLKVGKDLRTDVGVVDAVRTRVGVDVFLYVDANGGYSRLDARRAATRFAAAGVALFEEPLPPGDVAGRLALSRTGGVAILADESINDFQRFIEECLSGAIAAASLRALRAGFVGARDLVGISRAIPMSLLVGSHRELGVGTAANLHLAAAYDVTLPAELSSADSLEHTLLCEPLDVRHGRMPVPSGPGLGVELDDDAVRHYSAWSFAVGTPVAWRS